MAYSFPPDIAQLVQKHVAEGYGNEDEVLRDAMRVFEELKARQSQLHADIQVGIEQADQGFARPLDVSALIERCTSLLADEGIRD